MKGPIISLRTLPDREKILLGLCALLSMLLPGSLLSPAAAQEKAFYGIALIGDPHLPGKNLPAKISALRTIDGWPDIDRVVVLGDICKESGTPEEYAAAKAFFGRLRKPAHFVAGNHDYIYADEKNTSGKQVKALPDVRRVKLERFAETFVVSDLYGSERLGGYLMIYLSTQENPQIFLWVSGHMHVPATSESFSAPVNLYEGRVMNIHNPDMERKTIWTNVLRLYPNRIIIRIWDHAKGDWLDGLERTIHPHDQKSYYYTPR